MERGSRNHTTIHQKGAVISLRSHNTRPLKSPSDPHPDSSQLERSSVGILSPGDLSNFKEIEKNVLSIC